MRFLSLSFYKIWLVFSTLLTLLFFTNAIALSDREVSLNIDNSSDFAVAVWEHYSASPTTIQAATYTTLGGWTSPVTISNPTNRSTYPVVSVNESGDAVVVWLITDSGLSIRCLESSTFTGGSWSAPVMLSGTESVIQSNLTGNPSYTVRLSNTGNLTATWIAYSGTTRACFAATGTLPGWTGFVAPVQISP